MQIEGATTPAPEVAEATTPATEVETETADTAPEVVAENATDSTAEDQSEDTQEGTSDRTTELEERRAGLREADYTRKTQELAEHRKAAAAAKERFDGAAQQLEVAVRTLHADIVGEFGNVDWLKLSEENPAEAVRLQFKLGQKQNAMRTALEQLNQANEAKRQAETQESQTRIEAERRALLAAVPAWKDTAKYAQESAAISDFLTQSGFSPEEVQGITDHRHVLMARDAMLWRQQLAKAPKSQPMPKAPPPVQAAPTKAAGPRGFHPAMSDKDFAELRKRQIAQRR